MWMTQTYSACITVNMGRQCGGRSDRLNATGGAVNPKKCFWYAIDYVWNNYENWEYTPISEVDVFYSQIRHGRE